MIEKDFVVSIAKEAGGIIRSHFTLGIDYESKDFDKTPLTVADTKVNRLVIERVKEYYPNHRVMGEEENYNENAYSDDVWVCDPIDGTIPFTRGIPTSVFSLALLHKGKVVVGVIYDPYMDRMLVADINSAATLNGEEVRISKNKDLRNAVMAVPVWKEHHGQPDFRGIFCALIDHNVTILSVHSIAYSYMLLALGQFDAVLFPHFQPHDSAAARLIIEKAGGRMTNLAGEDQRYDQKIKGVLASNGFLHEELLVLLKKYVTTWTEKYTKKP